MKELLKSAAITFLAGMAIVIVPEINTLTPESFKDGTVVGLVFASVRTGLKMALEGFLAWRKTR